MMLSRFRADSAGNMSVLFAMAFTVSALVGAVAIDGASLYYEKRVLQNGVDLAALSAATDPAQAVTLAQATLVDAGLLETGETAGFAVVPGHYAADAALAPEQRFVAKASPINAVRVSLTKAGTLFFARSWAEAPTLGASAIAMLTPEVAFSVGSRLAGLDGGLANSVLGALLGGSVSLSAMDYHRLAGARIDLFGFLDALAQNLKISAGTYDDLLALSASHGQIATALAAALNGADRGLMQALAARIGENGVVPLNQLLQLGGLGKLAIGSGRDGVLATGFSALDMLAASAALGTGTRQVALTLGAGVPGLVSMDAVLAIGEPPQGKSWFAVGPAGTVVRTTQIRLQLTANLLGSGTLAGIPVRLPLYLELAHAEAMASAATCPTLSAPEGTATIAVSPGAMRLRIGEVDPSQFGDFGRSPPVALARLLEVRLAGLTVLKVLASAMLDVAQSDPVALRFSSADIAAGTLKSAHVATPIASLTTSLLDTLELQTPVLGLGLNLSSLRTMLRALVIPLAPVLDSTIDHLLSVLGLRIGEADVIVYGVRCSQPVLVG